jgi:FKBP-type peptidyl-prolyl cis-trans isomerase FkpA
MIFRFLLSICLVLSALSMAGCGAKSPTDPSQTTGVAYSQTDLTVGTGKVAAAGNTVTVNYTLWLYSPTATDNKGTQADTSIGRTPLVFVLGSGSVIKGFDQGTVGMAVGGKRRLIIPPSLGYGSAGAGGGQIPPNANLVFEVELLNVT